MCDYHHLLDPAIDEGDKLLVMARENRKAHMVSSVMTITYNVSHILTLFLLLV